MGFSSFIEELKERWITRRTGLTREQREYRAWCEDMVNIYASTVEDKYAKFQYVIEVDPLKFLIHHMWTEPVDYQYFFPHKPPGECALWGWVSGIQDCHTGKINILGQGLGLDYCFVATNDTDDALEIALRFK
jgi:hypothetical protein